MDLLKIEKHYKKVSYHKQHEGLTLKEWQYALRKKFAEKSTFGIDKNEGHSVFADYIVRNPESKSSYKVSIRDNENSMNFCSCYDFKTNNLGTCKHIEVVLLKLQQDPRLEKFLKTSYIPPYTSLYIDYRDGKKIKIRLGSEKKDEFKNLKQKYFDASGNLPDSKLTDFYTLYEEANKISNDFKCYPDVISLVVERLENTKRQNIIENKYGNKEVINKDIINATLYPYQQEGVIFAAKAGRCLIADDMGLGKTIQAIAAAEIMKKELGIDKVLIVCPTSLKYQWKTEIEKFTGSTVKVIEGAAHKRPEQYNSPDFYCITSYHTASNDIKIIDKLKPDLVILDEAQRIKNFKTKTSRNIKRIPSDYVIVLTGTPLENKLEELYSIVQFIDPFILGPFHEFIHNHQIHSDTGKVIGYQNLNQIGEKLSGLMIRRTKKQVLPQLPERTDKILFVPMTDRQAEWHEEYKSAVARLVHKWQRMGFLSEKDRQKLLINLNLMRMVCDSTFIVDQETRHDTKVDELLNIIEEIDAEGQEKVVVFSQWERMTRIVAGELDKKGIKYEYLHGGIPSAKRENLFTNFNNDPEVKVFLSTDAGGVGLNLQAASYLINVDIPWNPAVLEQRIARIHRIGQKRNISVTNMVSVGTIEHRMLDVLSFKSSLSKGILDNGEDAIFMGESKFKKFMKSVDDMVQPGKSSERSFTMDENEKEEIEDKLIKENPLAGENGKEPEANEIFEQEEVATIIQTEPEENLIASGLKLLGRLSETLADKEATRKLVASVIEKDEKTGKTYLKVPIENEKVIENAVSLIGSFLKSLNN